MNRIISILISLIIVINVIILTAPLTHAFTSEAVIYGGYAKFNNQFNDQFNNQFNDNYLIGLDLKLTHRNGFGLSIGTSYLETLQDDQSELRYRPFDFSIHYNWNQKKWIQPYFVVGLNTNSVNFNSSPTMGYFYSTGLKIKLYQEMMFVLEIKSLSFETTKNNQTITIQPVIIKLGLNYQLNSPSSLPLDHSQQRIHSRRLINRSVKKTLKEN